MITGTLPFHISGVKRICEMQYDESDPYSIKFAFRQPSEEDSAVMSEARWAVSRDLVVDGLKSDRWTGVGDFSIRRNSQIDVAFRLRPRDSDLIATVYVPYRQLHNFLQRTYNLVPLGTESDRIDWDEFEEERVTW